MFSKILEWLFGPKEESTDRFLGILGDGSDAPAIPFEEAVGLDVAAATSLDLKPSTPSDWRHFLHQYQNGSGGCVSFTIAKIAQIFYFLQFGRKIKFSPGWIYRRRKNRPKAGMYISDVIELASEGMITEELYPSEDLDDDEIDSLPEVPYGGAADAFSIPQNWVELPHDFDTIAKSSLKTKKGIMLWIRFGKGEFFNLAVPISNGSKQQYQHSVTVIEPVLYRGTEYLLIEDSADRPDDTKLEGKDFGARKLISRAWLAAHITLARYPLGFKFSPQEASKPTFDGSTASVQDCLTYEGLFPSNVTARGYWGPITIEAVQKFQAKYSIVWSGTPATTGYGALGPKTQAKLRELYP